uniref:Odorant receptor n=1 Tax=Rhodnius prolixus TaxID=13249 RepID=T1HDN9_RHOPR
MSPPSRHLFLLMTGGGMGYHPQFKFKWLIKVYAIYLFIMLMMNYYTLTMAWLSADHTDFDVKAELIQYYLECFHILAKFLNFLFRQKEVRELLRTADEIREACRSDPDNQSVIEQNEKTESTLARFTVIGAETVIVTFFACTWINYVTTGKKKLPLLYWIPFDSLKYFWQAVIFQLLLFLTPVQIYSCCMGFNVLLAMVATSQMRILQRLLTTRDSKAAARISTYETHQGINKLILQMNELLSGQFLFEISLSALILSIRIFAFIKAILSGKEGLVFTAGILLLAMSSPCVISWVGELIKSESEKIFEAAYDNVWYEEEVKTKKELILVLRASQRPHTLHYRHIISFNRQQFASMMQATYSYLTLLLRFGDL